MHESTTCRHGNEIDANAKSITFSLHTYYKAQGKPLDFMTSQWLRSLSTEQLQDINERSRLAYLDLVTGSAPREQMDILTAVSHLNAFEQEGEFMVLLSEEGGHLASDMHAVGMISSLVLFERSGFDLAQREYSVRDLSAAQAEFMGLMSSISELEVLSVSLEREGVSLH